MSFMPFLGGKRICLGKTFAENMSKVIGPTILNMFDFTFVDPIHLTVKQPNHSLIKSEPIVMVNIKERSLAWVVDIIASKEVKREGVSYLERMFKNKQVHDSLLVLIKGAIKEPSFVEDSKVFGKEWIAHGI
jgi:hypothetical protein